MVGIFCAAAPCVIGSLQEVAKTDTVWLLVTIWLRAGFKKKSSSNRNLFVTHFPALTHKRRLYKKKLELKP